MVKLFVNCLLSITKKYPVLIAVFLSCFNISHHEQVEVSATLYLTIVNNSDTQFMLEYIRPKKFEFGDSVAIAINGKINLKHDTLIFGSREIKIDTIGYEFTRADNCYITSSQAAILRLDLNAYQSDTLYYQTSVFPWCRLPNSYDVNYHFIS